MGRFGGWHAHRHGGRFLHLEFWMVRLDPACQGGQWRSIGMVSDAANMELISYVRSYKLLGGSFATSLFSVAVRMQQVKHNIR